MTTTEPEAPQEPVTTEQLLAMREQQQRQPQIDDEPESLEAAIAEGQQLSQGINSLRQNIMQMEARVLFLQGFIRGEQRGNANREQRRAASKARAGAKKAPAKKATKRAAPRKRS